MISGSEQADLRTEQRKGKREGRLVGLKKVGSVETKLMHELRQFRGDEIDERNDVHLVRSIIQPTKGQRSPIVLR